MERALYQRNYYLNNRADVIARRQRDLADRKKIVMDHYGNACACCKETGKTFLSIDHVNNDGYKDVTSGGKRKAGFALYQKIIKAGFPLTFQILCMNCNVSKHRNGGICEHKLAL